MDYATARARIGALRWNWPVNAWDDGMADLAARAMVAGTPAYLCSASYSNAVAGSLATYANTHGGIEAAWRGIERDHDRLNAHYERPETLDKLVPLNVAAVRDLAAVYEIVGTFRPADELIRRAERLGVAVVGMKAEAA